MALDYEELNRRREERKKQQASTKRQMKWLKLGLIMTLAVLILCGGALLITKNMLWQPQPPSTEAPETEATQPSATDPSQEGSAPTDPQPTEPQDTVIHFVAGGDLNITDKVIASGLKENGYDFTEMFMDVLPILAGADLSSINLEGNIYGSDYGSLTAAAPVQLLTALRNAGVDFIQTANSYSNANGLLGLRATLDNIRKERMEPVGSYLDSNDFNRTGGYTIREVNGIRVAVVAFTKGMNGTGLPQGSEDCVNLLYQDYSTTYQKVDTEGITRILRAAQSAKPDVTIALLHWGSVYNDQISDTQDKIVRLLQTEGVDAIVGTHPHYVQQVVFDDRVGRVVAYSLGDFMGDADRAGTDYSILLDLQITKDGATGKVKITGVEHIPVYLLDETAAGGGMRLVRIREAMQAYENNIIGRIPQKDYEAMGNALKRIEARVNGK